MNSELNFLNNEEFLFSKLISHSGVVITPLSPTRTNSGSTDAWTVRKMLGKFIRAKIYVTIHRQKYLRK